jgi:hypothetical protein
MRDVSSCREHAYLVLAHEDVAMLNLLVSRLVETGSVFVHIDRDCLISPDEIELYPSVYVYKAFRIKWGGWSIVEATRFLADKALVSGAKRLTLLSGLSYPIVSDDKLVELGQSDTDIFEAHIVDLEVIEKTFKRRFTSDHLEFKLGNSNFARIIRRASREFFALLPPLKPEKALNPLQLTFGSQWWSVSSKTYLDSMKKLIDHPSIEDYFKRIECSDESFFGTLFRAVSANHQNSGTTYVKWGSRGRPVVIQKIVSSEMNNFFFARKFSSRNIDISDMNSNQTRPPHDSDGEELGNRE